MLQVQYLLGGNMTKFLVKFMYVNPFTDKLINSSRESEQTVSPAIGFKRELYFCRNDIEHQNLNSVDECICLCKKRVYEAFYVSKLAYKTVFGSSEIKIPDTIVWKYRTLYEFICPHPTSQKEIACAVYCTINLKLQSF